MKYNSIVLSVVLLATLGVTYADDDTSSSGVSTCHVAWIEADLSSGVKVHFRDCRNSDDILKSAVKLGRLSTGNDCRDNFVKNSMLQLLLEAQQRESIVYVEVSKEFNQAYLRRVQIVTD